MIKRKEKPREFLQREGGGAWGELKKEKKRAVLGKPANEGQIHKGRRGRGSESNQVERPRSNNMGRFYQGKEKNGSPKGVASRDRGHDHRIPTTKAVKGKGGSPNRGKV